MLTEQDQCYWSSGKAYEEYKKYFDEWCDLLNDQINCIQMIFFVD